MDFESADPGSNPGMTFIIYFFFNFGPIAQSAERTAVNREVTGSTPVGTVFFVKILYFKIIWII